MSEAIRVFLLLLIFISFEGFAGERISKIEVFTNTKNAPYGLEKQPKIKVLVYDFDKFLRHKAKLRFRKPSSERDIRVLADKIMANLPKDEIKASFKIAALAMKYNLTKIPAIVFNDGEAVVYGVRDISVAVRYYDDWKKESAFNK